MARTCQAACKLSQWSWLQACAKSFASPSKSPIGPRLGFGTVYPTESLFYDSRPWIIWHNSHTHGHAQACCVHRQQAPCEGVQKVRTVGGNLDASTQQQPAVATQQMCQQLDLSWPASIGEQPLVRFWIMRNPAIVVQCVEKYVQWAENFMECRGAAECSDPRDLEVAFQ